MSNTIVHTFGHVHLCIINDWITISILVEYSRPDSCVIQVDVVICVFFWLDSFAISGSLNCEIKIECVVSCLVILPRDDDRCRSASRA